MKGVGVVAIGRNEGERLRRCLASVAGRGLAVAYVDSGSTDGSTDLARALGVEVVELDMSRPFSAARARNAGFDRLRAIAPDLRYVMFLDGDCEMVEGWLPRAEAEMEARPDAAVVCGRLREKSPEHSIYNRLADIEWDTPVGEATACGGIALMRADRFAAVGGFDPTVAAGEEPELCQRLRGHGWTVWRIDADMAWHDLGMTRFREWWRRAHRGGYNGLDVRTRFPGKDRPFARELARARAWAFGWPIVAVVGTTGAGVALGPRAGLLSGLALLALPGLQAIRLAARMRGRVDGWGTALAYGGLNVAGQFANASGQIGYLRDRMLGRTARRVESGSLAEPARPSPSSSPS
jgi:GT2 family glycosyltransferase